MNLYRHSDPHHPYTWETSDQPEARWHAAGEGPAHYFATTPDGAWAEFLRHEEIVDVADLQGLRDRAFWILEHEPGPLAAPNLPDAVLRGGLDTYATCQAEARRLRAEGAGALAAPSAALARGRAALVYLDDGEKVRWEGSEVVVLFGKRPGLHVRLCALGRPSPRILPHVRPL